MAIAWNCNTQQTNMQLKHHSHVIISTTSAQGTSVSFPDERQLHKSSFLAARYVTPGFDVDWRTQLLQYNHDCRLWIESSVCG